MFGRRPTERRQDQYIRARKLEILRFSVSPTHLRSGSGAYNIADQDKRRDAWRASASYTSGETVGLRPISIAADASGSELLR
jgi:hypothetical protein